MFLRANLPGIGWALLILFLCGVPGQQVPDPSFFDIYIFDKGVHAFMFLVLGFLLSIGFKKQYQYPTLKVHTKKTVFLITTVYGVLIEVLQYLVFLDRYFESSDILSNAAGAVAGVLVFRSIYGKELA